MTTQHSRRGARRATAFAGAFTAALLLLAGCAAPGTPPADSSSTDEAGDPQSGGSAVFALTGEPATLNPGITTDIPTLAVWTKIYDGLVWQDAAGDIHPNLATEWEISDDSLTYTFTLREGVTWQDGEPFTAADVVYTFTAGLAQNTRAQGALGKIASVTAPDDLTVEVVLSAPYAPFLAQMKSTDVPILPAHIGEQFPDITQSSLGQKPVGTGPFQLKSWEVGSAVTLVRYDDYWGDHPAYLDELILQPIPDAASRVLALETGEVDFLEDPPASDIANLEASDEVTVFHRDPNPNPWLGFLWVNDANGVLADPLVRQAMLSAIDRDRLVEQAMTGTAVAAKTAFGNGFTWLVNDDAALDELYPYDVEAAQALLDKAGVSGAEVRIAYMPGSTGNPDDGMQLVKEDLAKIGITATLVPLERSAFLEAVYTNRDFDLAFQTFTSSGDPAIGYHRIYVTNDEVGAVNQNPTGFSDAEVDELLSSAATDADRDARAGYYRDAQEILSEQLPVLPLFEGLSVVAFQSRLQDIGLGQTTNDQWQDVWIRE